MVQHHWNIRARVIDKREGEAKDIHMDGVMGKDELRARGVFKEMLVEEHAIGHTNWELEEWLEIEKIK